MSRLVADDVALSYDVNRPAIVKNLTLDLVPGELVGVLGPNGCGKSTLVRGLSRTLPPVRGIFTLDGRNLYTHVTARESARAIGVVPQTTEIAFDFTVRETVEMGRSPYMARSPFAALSAADHNFVEEALERVSMAHLSDRVVTTLSGGERQRVFVARVLAQNTNIVLLDEPTAHLDLRHQAQILSLAHDLAHKDGRSVLAVLHDPNLAAAHCDRIVLMADGRLVSDGPPDVVLTSDTVQQVFGRRVWVRKHPALGHPVLMSLPELSSDTSETDGPGQRVHVICGGGTGAAVISALWKLGYDVSAGALSVGDTDLEVAEVLEIPYSAEPPFSPLSDGVRAEAMERAYACKAAVLTDVPIAHGNVAILDDVLSLIRMGTRVFYWGSRGEFLKRDYTDGLGAEKWDEIVRVQPMDYASCDEAITALDAFLNR